MEMDTYHRHKLPVIALIGNDACWSQIARDQVPWFNSAVACTLDVSPAPPTSLSPQYTSYEEVGKALGADGLVFRAPSEPADELDKMAKAIEKSRTEKSCVINALIGKTDFRKGSISV